MIDEHFKKFTMRHKKGDDNAAITDGQGEVTLSDVASWATNVVNNLRVGQVGKTYRGFSE